MNNVLVHNILQFGYAITFRLFDKGAIEWFGPIGLVGNIYNTTLTTTKLSSGLLYHYSLVLVSSILFIFLFYTLFVSGFSHNLFILFIAYIFYVLND
jgi:hypothetical protein